MTLAQTTLRVRRLARATVSGSSDTVIMDAINDGQREFAKEAHGLIKENYLTLAPRFDTQTNFAIRLTVTGGTDEMAAADVAITGTARENTDGDTVAEDLQTTIRAAGAATTTVTWSTTTWTFTITAPADTTSITLAAPSGITYVNALNLLGLIAQTTTGYTINDNIPRDCAVETALPSDYLSLIPPVEWDGNELDPAPFSMFASPEVSGVPHYYGVRNDCIRLYPSPTSQKMFHIWYKYAPTAFTDAAGDADTELYIPTHYHMAVAYYAASIIAEESHEMKVSDRYLARFFKFVSRYVTAKANVNPALVPTSSRVRWPKVIPP